jgi:ABC-type multidrug transport system permease subunit
MGAVSIPFVSDSFFHCSDSKAIVKAFTLAELPFIFVAATSFTLVFYFIMGFAKEADRFFWYYLFVFLTLGSFTFLGHMLVSVFKDSTTAQGFGALIVAFSSLFGGVLIRVSEMPNFWIFMYWIFPGELSTRYPLDCLNRSCSLT